MLGFAKDDSHARWFGVMRSQTGECRIAPVGKTYNLAGLGSHFRHLTRLQNLEATPIEKKCVVPNILVSCVTA